MLLHFSSTLIIFRYCYKKVMHTYILNTVVKKMNSHDILLWWFWWLPPKDWILRNTNGLYNAPCCFLRALSHIAGLIDTGFPFLWIHLLEQTRTPKHDFFKMLTLWLLVFRIAHPDVCFFASSELGEYTYRTWPSGNSSQASYTSDEFWRGIDVVILQNY